MKKLLSILCLSTLVFSSAALSRTLNVFLAGPGVVGSELLGQISSKSHLFQTRDGLDIRVVGISNSRQFLINDAGIALDNWRSELMTAGESLSSRSFVEAAINANLPNKVFVDCTSNQAIADSYANILSSGMPVVTASKKANSGPTETYIALRTASAKAGANFYYDANVGAGLPMLSTVKALRQSGEDIRKIEGVFSGTLSYLFNSFVDGVSFSSLVRRAQQLGYTEPDPRDDLNGLDAARKLLILAREAGYSLEMKDIEIQRFLPDSCFQAESVEGFYKALQNYDDTLLEIRNEAAKSAKRPMFIASFADNKAKLSLELVDENHPFYHLSGCDNILSITTPNYEKSPLVIRGPGAGAGVTAGRVLEGIIRVGMHPSVKHMQSLHTEEL